MTSHEDTPTARRRRRRRTVRLTITFTPLIDIVFLLLLYFMLVAQFKSREELFQLDLPRAGTAAARADPFALPAEPVRIRVRSTGDAPDDLVITSDDPLVGSPRTLEEFTSAITAAATEALGSNQLVLVRPEPGTRWEHVLAVANAIKAAGLPRVHLLEPAP